MQTNFSYAPTTRHETALTRPAIAGLVAQYLASGKTIKRYASGVRALPTGAINRAIYGNRPAFYCIHAPIAHHTNA